jgi:hypothetical protein
MSCRQSVSCPQHVQVVDRFPHCNVRLTCTTVPKLCLASTVAARWLLRCVCWRAQPAHWSTDSFRARCHGGPSSCSRRLRVASGGRQSARARLCSSSACSSLCQCGAKCTGSWTLQLSDALGTIGKPGRSFMRHAVELSFALQWWSFQTCTLFRPGDSIATSCFKLHIACNSSRNLSMSSSSIVTPSSAAAGAATCASALMPVAAAGTSSLPCRSASSDT